MARTSSVLRFASEEALYLHKIASGEDVERWRRDALTELVAVQNLRGGLDRNELSAVKVARAAGASWTDIATAAGITRQSAWEKWSEDVDGVLTAEDE